MGQVCLLNLHFDMNEVKGIFPRETTGEKIKLDTRNKNKALKNTAQKETHLDDISISMWTLDTKV